MARSAKQLLDLPDEILNLVAEAVDHITSLRALACTCTRFQDHAERFIYRSLIIEHGAQARVLHKAISRRPRRAAMALNLVVAPSAFATRGIEHIPWMLEKMNCVKDIFIESPFCNRHSCSEFVEDQERYAKIFRTSSFENIDPSQRLLSQLVSCTLNFTGYQSRMCDLDAELASVFLHPNLKSLTISCVRIDGVELDHLKLFARRTPLSSLLLDECDMSTSGLMAILALPSSLKELQILEVSRQAPQRHALDHSRALLRALNLPRKSLESLCLSLRSPKLAPFTEDFDLSSFHALRELRIACQRRSESVYPTSLKWPSYAPPALNTLVFSEIEIQNRRRNVAFPTELQSCLKSLDPADLCHLAGTLRLSLLAGPDVRADGRKVIEELGKHFRVASSPTSQTSPSVSTCHNDGSRDKPRLCVSRLTKGRGTDRPYLYHECVPDELTLYDSSSNGSGWLNSTDRSSGPGFFPLVEEPFNLDFSDIESSEVLHEFDFDAFLDNAPVGPTDFNFLDGNPNFPPNEAPMGNAGTDLPAQAGAIDLNTLLGAPFTPVHHHIHFESHTDSVD